ncbi:MAG: class I SAM-dependent methyltransferase [Thermoguttaceae bacterium]
MSDYTLLDFGNGRRLENFGDLILDRPCPAAEPFRKGKPQIWQNATAKFVSDSNNCTDLNERGKWFFNEKNVDSEAESEIHTITFSEPAIRFCLKFTPFGHIGIFPEQLPNWKRIHNLVKAQTNPSNFLPCVLNLFAYTGGSTLAAGSAGAQVVHVDAAKNVVAWAKQNAEVSGLADAPIRWITEDALKFVQREIKRKTRYDLIILDPPSYGHGPKGETWRLSKDLPILLSGCFELLKPDSRFLMLTCHSPQYNAQKLSELVRTSDVINDSKIDVKAFPLDISSQNGGKLPAGYVCLYGDWRIG